MFLSDKPWFFKGFSMKNDFGMVIYTQRTHDLHEVHFIILTEKRHDIPSDLVR